MERLEPTRALALKVWWAFLWRAVLAAVASGFVVGVLIGVTAQVAQLSAATVDRVSAFLGLALGLGVSIEVMYRVLRKKFKGFEIALVSRQD